MTTLYYLLLALLGVLVGAGIGFVFALFQEYAAKRNARLAEQGRLPSRWSLIPGSGGRVAVFLFILAVVQIVCPVLFEGELKWWISGGVALGYGMHLYFRLRSRLKALSAGA